MRVAEIVTCGARNSRTIAYGSGPCESSSQADRSNVFVQDHAVALGIVGLLSFVRHKSPASSLLAFSHSRCYELIFEQIKYSIEVAKEPCQQLVHGSVAQT